MAEIPDAELASLRAAQELLAQMNNNPEARALLEASAKKVRPELETEADVAARLSKPLVEALDATKAELAELKTSLATKEQTAAEQADVQATDAAFQRLSGAGYTEDGITKIKGLMVDRKIADPEAAAALFDKMNPPAAAEQPGWSPTAWSLESTASQGVDTKALFQDTDRWADNQVGEVLRDIRRGNVT